MRGDSDFVDGRVDSTPGSGSWANPTTAQRFEGLALLLAAIWVFSESGQTWWLFGLLLLVPDVSMLGYLRGAELGAVIYNLGHTLVGPALLFGWAVIAHSSFLGALGAVWLAHIGVDRLAGYGLKYSDGFRHTHLGTIDHPSARRGSTGGRSKRLGGVHPESGRQTTEMEER